MYTKEKFSTQNSDILLQRVIQSSTIEGDLVLDFFLGSGTTVSVAQKMRRKWIGIEFAEYFHSVVLPRMKRTLNDADIKPPGGFFKYYALEQYEDVLRRARYQDVEPLFVQSDPYSQYVFLRDVKLLDNAQSGERVVDVDAEKDEVRVDLSKLYDDIDLAETLSCLTGKWIRRIHPDTDDPTRPGEVEFEDGDRVDLTNPPWGLIRPLIWW